MPAKMAKMPSPMICVEGVRETRQFRERRKVGAVEAHLDAKADAKDCLGSGINTDVVARVQRASGALNSKRLSSSSTSAGRK